MLNTLRQRDFALLWLAGVISLGGDWVLSVGLPIYVFLLTRSVAAISITLVANMAPKVVLGSLSGVFVDRWDRRRTLIVTNLLLALGLAPLLLVRSAALVWIVYAVAFAQACLEQFVQPAQSALLPSLVEEARLVPANSLLAVGGNAARLVGPALGGSIAGFFGIAGIVVADGASYVMAALLIALIGARCAATPVAAAAPSVAAAAARVVAEWLAGLGVVLRERMLKVLFLVTAITAVGEGVMAVLFVVFVATALHGGAQQLGDLMSAQAVGGLIGGALVAWLGKRVLSRRVMGACAVLFGAIDLVIFNAPHTYPLIAWPPHVTLLAIETGLFVVVGVPGVGMLTGMQSLMQSTVPAKYLGRVFGAAGALEALLAIVGCIAAAAFGPRLGTINVLNLQGGGYILAGLLLALLLPAARRAATAATARTTERRAGG